MKIRLIVKNRIKIVGLSEDKLIKVQSILLFNILFFY